MLLVHMALGSNSDIVTHVIPRLKHIPEHHGCLKIVIMIALLIFITVSGYSKAFCKQTKGQFLPT